LGEVRLLIWFCSVIIHNNRTPILLSLHTHIIIILTFPCRYSVTELRTSTLGIIGYGDIGRATARLAKAFGMKILALVRESRSVPDEYADEVIVNDAATNDGMNRIFAESDYVLCALPLTTSTTRCIGATQFAMCKPNCVFINVGRGPIVDEDALIDALRNKQLLGAALDVFTIEPLPTSSPFWDMDNVLLSPHNMDQTDTFLLESTTFFVQEQLPRFVRGLPLLNQVNPIVGY
jgi:phosphoglycerate dehydrogenase-like enzyme